MKYVFKFPIHIIIFPLCKPFIPLHNTVYSSDKKKLYIYFINKKVS